MRQEIKIILIVVSATLAALFVHHSLEQAQASAGTIAWPKLPDADFTLPTFD